MFVSKLVWVFILAKKQSKKTVKSASGKKAPPSVEKSVKPPSQETQPSGSKKLVITPSLRKNWLKIRQAYSISLDSFTNTLSSMNGKEANELYDMVKLALFKGSIGEIVSASPELRIFMRQEDDRLCMIESYEYLSWKLGREEPFPKGERIKVHLRRSILGKLY